MLAIKYGNYRNFFKKCAYIYMIKNYEEAIKYIFDFEYMRDYSLEKVKICANKL